MLRRFWCNYRGCLIVFKMCEIRMISGITLVVHILTALPAQWARWVTPAQRVLPAQWVQWASPAQQAPWVCPVQPVPLAQLARLVLLELSALPVLKVLRGLSALPVLKVLRGLSALPVLKVLPELSALPVPKVLPGLSALPVPKVLPELSALPVLPAPQVPQTVFPHLEAHTTPQHKH